ncbi:MAG: tetratricopeptide repeat protein [Candidatus Wallbacteria bacterium]|nr:tetratricopeptide repeat protein [Candidatus Wallbacteria bacterium]
MREWRDSRLELRPGPRQGGQSSGQGWGAKSPIGFILPLLLAFSAALAAPALKPTGDELVDRARAALAQGRQAEAEKLLAKPSRSGQAASLLGTILLRSGRYAQAVAVLEEASRKLPTDPYPRGLRATALSELGRPAEALAAAEEARRLDPQGLDALRLLSDLHARAKRYRELVDVSEELVRKDSKDPVALFRAALGEAGLGHLPKAREWAQRAAELAPAEPRTWLLLGRIEQRMGRAAQARERYARAQAAGLSAADILEAELGRAPSGGTGQ